MVRAVWVLKTKTSQEQQQELYPLLDHADARLVKNLVQAFREIKITSFIELLEHLRHRAYLEAADCV